MNHVGLVGRITKDPELRYYNEKRPYTVFTLAINRTYKNNQGNVEADFIQCCAWGRLAETITKHCGKGSMIGVNGRLITRSFVNQQNAKVSTIDVVVEDVRFYQLKTPALIDLNEFEKPMELGEENEERSPLINNPQSSKPSIVAEQVHPLTTPSINELPVPS